eukprot:UN06812
MPFNPQSKYIFVGRDYRDIIWSFYNHFSLFSDDYFNILFEKREYEFTEIPKPNFNDGSFTEYDLWNMMLTQPQPDDGTVDGFPFWSQLLIVGSWWNVRNLANIKMIHYNNLKEDLAASMREIAQFLELEIDENNFQTLIANCSIEAMRNKENPLGPGMNGLFTPPKKFFNKGVNNRWTGVLTEDDIQNYRDLARVYLDDDGIHWLETGKFI